ncbi:MAG: hypothetical protein JNL11_10065 [Bdellovibrionaceae bacterium]|nr:hypothetical protein [Pseudobdellovibrionaceae bacterium]
MKLQFPPFLFFVLVFSFFSLFASANENTDEIESVRKEGRVYFSDTEAITEKGDRYIIQDKPNDPELLAQFEAMSPTEQETFYRRRNEILAGIIDKAASDKQKNFLGRYTIIKDTVVKFVTRKNQSKNGKMTPEDILQLGKDQVQSLITNIENELWRSSKVIGNTNVKGKSFTITGAFGFGLDRTGFMQNWGLGIGYYKNELTGDKYTELFIIRERFQKTFTYMAAMFGGVRVGWLDWRSEKSVNWNNENETDWQHGKSLRTKGTVNGTGVSLPLILPYIYRAQAELSMTTRLGVDLLDIPLPWQTMLQVYLTDTKKRYLRFNRPGRQSLCRNFYHQ